MEALKMAALIAMDNMRNNLRELENKREKSLDELTKIHVEIGYAKKDLEHLESDFKNLQNRDGIGSTLNPSCGVGNGNYVPTR